MTERVLGLFQQLANNRFGFFGRLQSVADIMTPEVFTLSLDGNLGSAIQLFRDHGFRHAPVVDPETKDVVGIVSDRDLLRHQPRQLGTLLEGDKDGRALTIALTSVMTRKPVHVSASTSLQSAISLMLDKHIDCLLVYDSPLELQGILTPSDFLKAVLLYQRVCPGSGDLKRLRLVDVDRGLAVDEIFRRGAQTIRDVMSYPVSVLSGDKTVAEAMALMQKNVLRHIPVVDERGRLIGIVSDRDVLKALTGSCAQTDAARDNGKTFRSALFATDGKDPALREAVTSIMSPKPTVVRPESLLGDAISTFLDSQISCLVAVDADNHVCGIITTSDVLHLIRITMRLGSLQAEQHGK
jgi:acetoin utilization protein AcuB